LSPKEANLNLKLKTVDKSHQKSVKSKQLQRTFDWDLKSW